MADFPLSLGISWSIEEAIGMATTAMLSSAIN